MTPDTIGSLLMMATQTLHLRPVDLSMLFSGGVGRPHSSRFLRYAFGAGRMIVNPDLGILKPLVTLVALRMGDLDGLRQRNLSFGMTGAAGCPLPLMTFKASFFGRAEGRWVVGVVVDIVVAGGAEIFKPLNMKLVRN